MQEKSYSWKIAKNRALFSNSIFEPYHALAFFKLDIQEFKMQNFNTFSIIPENLNILSSIVLEELSGQNNLSKNNKIGYFTDRKYRIKIRLCVFYSPPKPTYPENFLNIRLPSDFFSIPTKILKFNPIFWVFYYRFKLVITNNICFGQTL